MSLRKCGLAAVVFALVGLAGTGAHASVVTVDQQNTSGGFFSGTAQTLGDGVGQSFIPTFTSMDAVDIVVGTGGASSTVRLDIFSGNNFTGPLLASSATQVITNSVPAPLGLTLSSPLTLVPGNIYTFRLTRVADSGFAIEYGGNNYANGQVWDIGNISFPNIDLVFAVGLSTSLSQPVPLPTTATMGIATAGVVLLRRRRA